MFKKFLFTTAAIVTMASAPAFADMHSGSANHDKTAEQEAPPNIVEIATTNPDFSTLATALTEAGLVETIQNAEDITVFAPTNAAFEKLPEGTLDTLLLPENREKLKSILTYHVVQGKIMADDIATGSTDVDTLQGTTATVVKTDAGVTVDGATVTTADVKAGNGVVHIIDTVMMPE